MSWLLLSALTRVAGASQAWLRSQMLQPNYGDASGATAEIEVCEPRALLTATQPVAEIAPAAPAVNEPELGVLLNGVDLQNNVSRVDFGSTVRGAPIVRTFTVRNSGTAPLNLWVVHVPQGFTVLRPVDFTVHPSCDTTFEVRLDAEISGAFEGRLWFMTNDRDEMRFEIGIRGNVTGNASDISTIDDGDAGFSSTNNWIRSATGRGNDVRYATAGDGSQVASWTFTGLASGFYRISATWPGSGNRSSTAQYRAREWPNTSDLKTFSVNQQSNPQGYSAEGSTWQELGSVSINGSQLIVQLTNSTSRGIVVADAIRIERIPGLVIDDGQAGFSTTGAWVPTLAGRDGDVRYAAAGNGSSVATWNFSGLAPGSYRISATWPASANRANNAPFRVRNTVGGPDLLNAAVNQRLTPVGFSAEGSTWQSIGTVTITGNTLVVQLTNNTSTGFVIADGIRVDRATTTTTQIIDDGAAGFSTTGTWTTRSGGREGDTRFAAGGGAASVATWNFTGLAAGTYHIAATWTDDAYGASNAPYRVRSSVNGPDLLTAQTNHRVRPGSFTSGGTTWESLGTITITGNTIVVQLSNNANGNVIADAVRIERVG